MHDNTGKMLETFSIKTPAGQSDHASVDSIAEQFFERLAPYMTEELCATKATVFFFEDLYVPKGPRGGSGNAGNLIGRAKAVGVLEYQLRQAGLVAYAVLPDVMTSFLLGKAPRKRADKKEAVKQWLHHNRNYYTRNDNLADAYGLAEFGYAFLIEGQKLSCRPLCALI